MEAIEAGERKLRSLLWTLEQRQDGEWLWVWNVDELAADLLHPEYPDVQLSHWFRNINTPEEWLDAEARDGPE